MYMPSVFHSYRTTKWAALKLMFTCDPPLMGIPSACVVPTFCQFGRSQFALVGGIHPEREPLSLIAFGKANLKVVFTAVLDTPTSRGWTHVHYHVPDSLRWPDRFRSVYAVGHAALHPNGPHQITMTDAKKPLAR